MTAFETTYFDLSSTFFDISTTFFDISTTFPDSEDDSDDDPILWGSVGYDSPEERRNAVLMIGFIMLGIILCFGISYSVARKYKHRSASFDPAIEDTSDAMDEERVRELFSGPNLSAEDDLPSISEPQKSNTPDSATPDSAAPLKSELIVKDINVAHLAEEMSDSPDQVLLKVISAAGQDYPSPRILSD